ncbi:MAG: DUF853 family protein [Eubacteriales bacterium]|nr:DUF853 family protein [Eubacteriales bacterium]
MYYNNQIYIGKSEEKEIFINPKMVNRHGLICGATGTGKTITLKVLAEDLSDMGVPVFLSDIKGDLAGMCKDGIDNENMQNRISFFNLKEKNFTYSKCPSAFFDIYGKGGIQIRTTISEMGPILLSRILDLNDVQSDVLTILFKIADDAELLLIDIKDLKKMINFCSDNSKELSKEYGMLNKQSLNSVLRAIVALEQNNAHILFNEPSLDINDLFRVNANGKGYINILDSSSLVQDSELYSIFMLWLLSELFEVMPEVGDLEKPKMVFFFDEAHLLFSKAPKALLNKIEQLVKLIRSKGVGVFFITQSPLDIPDSVISQLGLKIQHALRAYTPKEQKAIKSISQSFRANPNINIEKEVQELATGEALVSFLKEDGTPSIVERTKICPPHSLMGTINDSDREEIIKADLLYTKYDKLIDRESAYEVLSKRDEKKEKEEIEIEKKNKKEKSFMNSDGGRLVKSVLSTTGTSVGRTVVQKALKAAGINDADTARIAGNIGATLGRGLLGSFFR